MKGVSDEPGPGSYNIAVIRAHQPTLRSRSQPKPTFPQSVRFDDKRSGHDSTVGPGSHEVAGSLIKKTFNITFGGARSQTGAGHVVHREPHAPTKSIQHEGAKGKCVGALQSEASHSSHLRTPDQKPNLQHGATMPHLL